MSHVHNFAALSSVSHPMIEIFLKFDPTKLKAGSPVMGSGLEQLDDLYHTIWGTSIPQFLHI